MVIAAVDPNKKDLKQLVKYLRMAFQGCEVVMFSDPHAAASYIRENPIDALYTEAVMEGLNGFALQSATEAVQPAVFTVFVTATKDYAAQALKSRAQDYIVKPVTLDAIGASMRETKFHRTANSNRIQLIQDYLQ